MPQEITNPAVMIKMGLPDNGQSLFLLPYVDGCHASGEVVVPRPPVARFGHEGLEHLTGGDFQDRIREVLEGAEVREKRNVASVT